VTFDRTLLNELATLRFLESHHHVAIVGPLGVGKTFLAHALGHIACRRGHSVLAARADLPLPGEGLDRRPPREERELRAAEDRPEFPEKEGSEFPEPATFSKTRA
jgi:hypothetical protein